MRRIGLFGFFIFSSVVSCALGIPFGDRNGDGAVHRMFLKRSSSDMDASATTGFIYRSEHNGPTQALYFGGVKHQPQNVPASYPFPYHAAAAHSYVVAHSANGGVGPSPSYPKFEKIIKADDDDDYSKVLPLIPEYIKKPADEPSAEIEDENSSDENIENDGSEYDDDEIDDPLSYKPKEYLAPAVSYYSSHNYHPHKDNDDESQYSKSHGSTHESDEHSKKGDKTSKGYKSDHSYSHGNAGKHDRKEDSGHYNQKGGNKKSYVDEAHKYHDHHDESKSSRGGKHSEKKFHKKGSKTTGYHNVYHKDEFKKDHIFYDTADHTGEFSKYGSAHKDHSANSGQKQQGGYHDSGYKEGNRAKQGFHDKGHYDNEHKGFHNKHGQDSHHSDGEKYHKNNGQTGNHEHGHKQSATVYY